VLRQLEEQARDGSFPPNRPPCPQIVRAPGDLGLVLRRWGHARRTGLVGAGQAAHSGWRAISL